METTKLSSKGQIIIPKSLRTSHQWQPGTEFLIEEREDGIFLRPRKPFPPTTVDQVLGCTGYEGPPKTLEEMDRGVLEEARRRWARTKE